MWSQLITGLVGSIFSGLTSLFGMKRQQKYQLEQMAQQNEYQKEQMALQNDYQLGQMQQQYEYAMDAWNRENEYNDPSRVRARYENAGISPQAALQGGASGAGMAGSLDSGSMPSGPSAGTPTALGVQNNFNSDLLDGLRTAAQVATARAEIKKKEKETENIELQNQYQQWMNNMTPLLESIKREELRSASAKALYDEIKATYSAAKEENDIAIQGGLIKQMGVQTRKLEAEIQLTHALTDYQKGLFNNLDDVAENIRSSTARNLAETDKLKAETQTENELRTARLVDLIQAANLKDCTMKEIDAKIIQYGHQNNLTHAQMVYMKAEINHMKNQDIHNMNQDKIAAEHNRLMKNDLMFKHIENFLQFGLGRSFHTYRH